MPFRSIIRAMLLILACASLTRAALPEDPATDYQMGNQALQDLLATPLGRTLPRLPWKIQILESWQVNAYSNGTGAISLTRGLGWVLDDHLGLWAAAIAHELAHSIMLAPDAQPQFDAELRRAYVAAGGNLGDAQAAALSVTPAHAGMLRLGGQRRVEYEADRLGLLLMAEAGFHPDFAVAMDRRMLSTIGEDTKYSEFLLSHPIWSKREQQNEQDESVPLAIFNKLWPDAARSPGGPAPPFGKVQSVVVTADAGGLVFDVKFEMKNVGGRPARVAALLLDRNHKVRSPRAEYQAPDGSLAVNAMLPGFNGGPGETTLRIPRDAIPAGVDAGSAKLRAAIFLVAGDWTLDLWFQPLAPAGMPEKPSPQ